MTLLADARHRLHNAACALFFGTNNTDTRDAYHTALDALTAALQDGDDHDRDTREGESPHARGVADR